jgi:protein phosphatase 1 regulatory subunit 7
MNLNPQYIANNIEKFGKQEAKYLLKGWIENSQKAHIRNQSLQLLGEIDDGGSFSFYEQLYVSDNDVLMRMKAGEILKNYYAQHPDFISLLRYTLRQDWPIDLILFAMRTLRERGTYHSRKILVNFIERQIEDISVYYSAQLPDSLPFIHSKKEISKNVFEICLNIVLYNYYKNVCSYNVTMRDGLIILLNCDGAGLESVREIAKLSQLGHLQYLSLKRNNLKSLEGLSNQYQLLKLDASHNQITEITHLDLQQKLKELNLSYNHIKTIKNLKHLQNLENLDLSHNRIKYIQNLLHLSQLKYLNLSHNKIETIESLCGLKNLKKLNLSYNYIRASENLIGLPNLIWLYLNDNRIEKIQGLADLQELRGLFLSHNKIQKIEGLDQLTNLRKLELSENLLTKIEGLDNNKNLQELYLDKNKITELEGLERLERLIILFLEQNEIQQFDLTKIKNLKTLDRFFLNDNPLSKESIRAYRNFRNY